MTIWYQEDLAPKPKLLGFGIGLAGFRTFRVLVLSGDVNVSDNHLCAEKEP